MDPKAEPPVPPPVEPMPPAGDGLIPRPDGAVVGQPVPGPAPRPPLDKGQARTDLLINIALFGAVVAIFGIIFALAKWWVRRQADDCDHSSMSLGTYREMYENGELTEEEYRQIRDKMAAKMKGGLNLRLPAEDGPKSVGPDGTAAAPENPS